MKRRLDSKQKQVHELRHKLRKMRRFLDDLPNGIKMRFFKNNINVGYNDDDSRSVGSTTSDVTNFRSKVFRKKMAATPVPGRSDLRKKGKTRPRTRAKMTKVVGGKVTNGIKRKKKVVPASGG